MSGGVTTGFVMAACVVALGFFALMFIVGMVVLSSVMRGFDSAWRGGR